MTHKQAMAYYGAHWHEIRRSPLPEAKALVAFRQGPVPPDEKTEFPRLVEAYKQAAERTE
jgi:hypothetical protein